MEENKKGGKQEEQKWPNPIFRKHTSSVANNTGNSNRNVLSRSFSGFPGFKDFLKNKDTGEKKKPGSFLKMFNKSKKTSSDVGTSEKNQGVHTFNVYYLMDYEVSQADVSFMLWQTLCQQEFHLIKNTIAEMPYQWPNSSYNDAHIGYINTLNCDTAIDRKSFYDFFKNSLSQTFHAQNQIQNKLSCLPFVRIIFNATLWDKAKKIFSHKQLNLIKYKLIAEIEKRVAQVSENELMQKTLAADIIEDLKFQLTNHKWFPEIHFNVEAMLIFEIYSGIVNSLFKIFSAEGALETLQEEIDKLSEEMRISDQGESYFMLLKHAITWLNHMSPANIDFNPISQADLLDFIDQCNYYDYIDFKKLFTAISQKEQSINSLTIDVLVKKFLKKISSIQKERSIANKIWNFLQSKTEFQNKTLKNIPGNVFDEAALIQLIIYLQCDIEKFKLFLKNPFESLNFQMKIYKEQIQEILNHELNKNYPPYKAIHAQNLLEFVKNFSFLQFLDPYPVYIKILENGPEIIFIPDLMALCYPLKEMENMVFFGQLKSISLNEEVKPKDLQVIMQLIFRFQLDNFKPKISLLDYRTQKLKASISKTKHIPKENIDIRNNLILLCPEKFIPTESSLVRHTKIQALITHPQETKIVLTENQEQALNDHSRFFNYLPDSAFNNNFKKIFFLQFSENSKTTSETIAQDIPLFSKQIIQKIPKELTLTLQEQFTISGVNRTIIEKSILTAEVAAVVSKDKFF